MRRFLALGFLLVASVGWVSVLRWQESDMVRPRDRTRQFMIPKLTLAERLLAAIVREDFDELAEAASAMSILSLDESWAVLQTPEYLERSTAFRRTVKDLRIAAREENLDRAGFLFLQLSSQCFDCHRELRPREGEER